MALLADATLINTTKSYYAIAGSEIQELDLVGNDLTLIPDGGTVDLSTVTAVATSTNKLTEVSFDNGIGETKIQGNEIFLDPVNSVNILPKVQCPRYVCNPPGGAYTEISNEPTVQGIYTTGNVTTLGDINMDKVGLPGATITYDSSQRLKLTATDGLPTSLVGAEMTENGALGAMFFDTYKNDGVATRHLTMNIDAGAKSASIGGNGGVGYTSIDVNTGAGNFDLILPGAVNINKDISNGNPTINFIESSSSTAVSLEADPQTGVIQADAPTFNVKSGMTDGVAMGVDTTYNINYFTGLGNPLRLCETQAKLISDYIEFNGSPVGGGITVATLDSITNQAGVNVGILVAGGQNLLCANGNNAIGVITQYDNAFATNILCDVDALSQILTNNAYVPMTWYKQDISFTIDATQSLAFETDDFVWRYSGQFGPSGLTGDSRYCGAVKFQVDVNVGAEDMNDTIVWWVELRDLTTGTDYQSMDFKNERFGYVNERGVNPSNGIKNQTFSFSSVFDLTSAGSPPSDSNSCRFRLFGWGNASTNTPRANVSLTVRPLRTLI